MDTAEAAAAPVGCFLRRPPSRPESRRDSSSFRTPGVRGTAFALWKLGLR